MLWSCKRASPPFLHFIFVLIAAFSVVSVPSHAQKPVPETYRQFADEIEANLQKHVLHQWFPRALDREQGGFHQNYNEDWSRAAKNEKSLVYQSRLTWTAAQAAMRYPQQASEYKADARHGLDFLSEKLWDSASGGFFWELDEKGQPARNGEKHVYGISFALYAAAAVYQATQDARALDLARRAFFWLEKYAHDASNGGYYEALNRAGKPILKPDSAPDALQSDSIGTSYGYKSMNSHIHLLEACTALYAIWPDPLLRTRLRELFMIVRNKIFVEPGCLNMFFTPNWQAVPEHDSFGHDVETAYLLVEASAALGQPEDSGTWNRARQLVDHALRYGWDEENGGFYDSGLAFSGPLPTDEKASEKIWWVQAEGLNALLLMHTHYGKETPRYWQAFVKQWEFINSRLIDHRYGGWYTSVRRDGSPFPGHIKSDAWTESYHQGRALLHISAILHRIAGDSATSIP